MEKAIQRRFVLVESTAAAVDELLHLSESKLQETVLEPLLSALGFENIKDSSGPHERGKDLVATKENEFGRVELYSIQIKLWKPRAKSAASDSFGLLLNQLAQAIQEPVINPNTHLLQKPDKCIFFTPYPVPMRAEEDYHSRLLEIMRLGVEIIDGPQIIRLLINHAPGALEGFSTDVQYRLRVFREVTRIPESRAAFEGNDLDLARIYVAVSLVEDPLIESMTKASPLPCLVTMSPDDLKRVRIAIKSFDVDKVFDGIPQFNLLNYEFKDGYADVDLRSEFRPIDAIFKRYVNQRHGLMSKDSSSNKCTEIAVSSIYLRKRLQILKEGNLLAKSWDRLLDHGAKREPLLLSLST